MRATFVMVCFVVGLAAVPAQAQHRSQAPGERSGVRLYENAPGGFSLNQLFSPAHFRMSHTYEMSMGGFGGTTSSLGMYTNSLLFQFNPKWAARVDLSFAHQPFGGSAFGPDGQDNTRFFLRNAEIAYRPNERTRFHFQVRQSPYGSYMSPYGYYSPYAQPYGHRAFMGASSRSDDLFWNDTDL